MIAERIEAKYPKQFKVQLNQDSGVTGRLEVTIYFNQQDAPAEDAKNGVVVHSKAKGQGYPYTDWKGFDARFAGAVTANTK